LTFRVGTRIINVRKFAFFVMTAYRNSHNQLNSPSVTLNLWALCGAVGIRLALPLVLFIPLAITFDKKLGTLPWITLISLPIALAASALLIKRDLERMSFIKPRKNRGKL
jgi:hypothetical protein